MNAPFKEKDNPTEAQAHTPTPWETKAVPNPLGVAWHIRGSDNNIVCRVESRNDAANAAFIVRACNSHDELLEALEKIVEFDKHNNVQFQMAQVARAAIAKAKS